jgi:hypothetical protein
MVCRWRYNSTEGFENEAKRKISKNIKIKIRTTGYKKRKMLKESEEKMEDELWEERDT